MLRAYMQNEKPTFHRKTLLTYIGHHTIKQLDIGKVVHRSRSVNNE